MSEKRISPLKTRMAMKHARNADGGLIKTKPLPNY